MAAALRRCRRSRKPKIRHRIHKRWRKRTRIRQRGKGLPLMLAKMLGPLVMGGVADFAFKKLRSKL